MDASLEMRPLPPGEGGRRPGEGLTHRVGSLIRRFATPSPGGRRYSRLVLVQLLLLCTCSLLAQTSAHSLADLMQAGNLKAALERIRAGADVNSAQPDGTRPIHWAIYQVDYDLLAALIAKKANVNVRNEFGATPIADAAKIADA